MICHFDREFNADFEYYNFNYDIFHYKILLQIIFVNTSFSHICTVPLSVTIMQLIGVLTQLLSYF